MIVGYGICGKGEAKRYLRETLEEFKRLCDAVIIVGNNIDREEREMIREFGFYLKEDNREWGTEQHHIKQDLMASVAKLKPDYCVCLDMDEVFDKELTKSKLIDLFETGDALYFYIVNLWNDGWNRKWSFWNIRAWKWSEDLKFENKPLHCGLAPAWCYRYASYAPYFIKHYGLMTKESRKKKIERYNKYDPEAKYKDISYYNALSSEENEPIDEKFIRQKITEEIGIQKKRRMNFQPQKDMYYIRRMKNGQDIGIIEVTKDLVDETLIRHPEWQKLSKVGRPEIQITNAPVKDQLECPFCGKVQDTFESLIIHKQSCV